MSSMHSDNSLPQSQYSLVERKVTSLNQSKEDDVLVWWRVFIRVLERIIKGALFLLFMDASLSYGGAWCGNDGNLVVTGAGTHIVMRLRF